MPTPSKFTKTINRHTCNVRFVIGNKNPQVRDKMYPFEYCNETLKPTGNFSGCFGRAQHSDVLHRQPQELFKSLKLKSAYTASKNPATRVFYRNRAITRKIVLRE